MSFYNILEKYRSKSFSEHDKGTRFERLMRAYLCTDPKYTSIVKSVWLWEDFFARSELGGKDTGIDLVAQTVGGEYWAIQCKCYSAEIKIDKPDVDTFLSTSGRTFTDFDSRITGFTQRVWISTTDNWSVNAENALHGQKIPVIRINLTDLDSAPVNWEKLEDGVHGGDARSEKYELKPHQDKAVQDVHEYFEHKKRGKLIMACGTGKTFTSLRIAEREAVKNNLVLVLVPSIALVGQTLREWTAHSNKTLFAICVCSDPRVSQSRKKNDEINGLTTLDLTLPATTKPSRVLEQYETFRDEKADESLIVVFSTYQSIEVVEKAQAEGLPEFDLIICDEAHRTTGVKLSGEDSAAFIRVHDNALIKGARRLYMTATPRLYTDESKAKARKNDAVLCSMDDAGIYGEEIYRIGFGEAVEKNLLSDYKVLIFTVSDKDVPTAFQTAIANTEGGRELPADTAAQLVGCINALSKQVWGVEGDALNAADPGVMKRAVAFCQSIETSRRISRLFDESTAHYIDSLPEVRREKLTGIASKHIDGTMNAPKREELLSWLKSESDDADRCKILSNVRCLSEGVDVPALDAVLFLSARNSQIDVVQSVGRVMRKAEGKNYGYIIIPVLIPSNVEPDKALDDNDRYRVIWSVLNALRAHDDRFNATVNKIDLNKKRPDNILIGGMTPDGDIGGDTPQQAVQLELALENFQELQNVIYARLVQKVGERRYWEEWAKSVADIAQRQIERITNIVSEGKAAQEFNAFLNEMRSSIDASITKDGAIEMLSQHSITSPVFDALFENYAFARNNAVSVAMELMLEELSKSGDAFEDMKELESFYRSVRNRAEGVDNAEGRQKIIIELYNTFFKTAFPKMSERLGIVYTPVEIVDFIIHSVGDVLQAEFGCALSDKNVNILDPFTGTGTFITRLIQSGLIDKADLPRKYESEIFANEIVLLAYYIAAVNIENAYHDALNMNEYKPFEGIVLTDTFQAWEEGGPELKLFDENSERVERQNAVPLTVIFGNPPYSVGQKSANDNAQNQSYPVLDKSIADSYAALSEATNKNALYDSYIRAFRYATDRLRGGDGIICFVSNGAWLDGSSTAGFRKSLEMEFSKVFVFNLRGNQRTSGELSRKEGGKVFGSGSRTPVAITLLVHRSGFEGKAEIFYKDIGDYLDRKAKLNTIREIRTFLNSDMGLIRITPNEYGDWITTRNVAFQSFIPLAGKKKFDVKSESVFVVKSRGFETSRDAWVYSFSSSTVCDNMRRMVDFYNCQIGADEPDYDPTRISWSSSLLSHFTRQEKAEFEIDKVTEAIYRPFNKQFLYFGDKMIHRRGQFPEFFPSKGAENLLICVSGSGVTNDFSALISNRYADLEFVGKSQCFPLYYYEEQMQKGKKAQAAGQIDIGGKVIETKYIRKDGISDFILERARKQYGSDITKKDVFFYVYGFLHSKSYRETFSNDLKKSLPRIPFVDNPDDFRLFSKAGRDLAELHLNYENVSPPDSVIVVGDRSNSNVIKMRFISKERKDVILYNENIRIENIPVEAYEYVINGKSAIEWVMERYQYKVDKASGIVNDPNLYAIEIGKHGYILDLLLSVIAVSVRSVDIITELPKIDF